MTQLQATLHNLKIGKTSYFYVLDARPGKGYGTLLVYPSIEGKVLLDAKDPSGRAFIKEILERKNGSIRYPWFNKELGETSPRDKVVAFSYVKGLEWVVAGGTYADEYSSEVRAERNLYIALGICMVLLISCVLYALIHRMVVAPLRRATAQLLAQGDLSFRLQVDRGDEVGQLMVAMNKIGGGLTGVIHAVQHGAEGVASASAQIAQATVTFRPVPNNRPARWSRRRPRWRS